MLHASDWNAYRVVTGQRERKRQHRKREDNIKTDLKEIHSASTKFYDWHYKKYLRERNDTFIV